MPNDVPKDIRPLMKKKIPKLVEQTQQNTNGKKNKKNSILEAHETERRKPKKNLKTKQHMPENTRQERRLDQKSEIEDIATHLSGNPTKNAQSQSRHDIFLTLKGFFAKVCTFEHRRQQLNKDIMQPKESEEGDTEKSINIITELKHVTNRKTQITMTIKIDETYEEFFADTGSPVTKTPSGKEY